MKITTTRDLAVAELLARGDGRGVAPAAADDAGARA
jgi:hypothetical protein